ncbi:hypothetical protein [Ottowia testudinis]|uniref:Uncharacterized protein n=1 Tax=Ottowia testudinis TaxID=2816950 RepID=A0A975H3Q1_9BURK|nr:hypothetical protein [Ottowia testudinis]QTD45481.1 hypothetical protein J1M35_00700 [Ottowia testudinis]
MLQDPKLVSQDGWQKLILIGEVNAARTKVFGYSYNQQGDGRLTSPSSGISAERLEALHRIMQADNATGRGWLKCMIRVSHAGEIGADFEYDDPERWCHTPDNYQDRIKEYAALPV